MVSREAGGRGATPRKRTVLASMTQKSIIQIILNLQITHIRKPNLAMTTFRAQAPSHNISGSIENHSDSDMRFLSTATTKMVDHPIRGEWYEE